MIGANEFGGKRSVLNRMSTINGLVNPLPNSTHVTYTLSTRSNSTYTLKLPIIARVDTSCLAASPGGSSRSNERVSYPYPGRPLTIEEQDDMMAHPEVNEMWHVEDHYPLKSASDSALFWGEYKSQSNFILGIIRWSKWLLILSGCLLFRRNPMQSLPY